MAMMSDFKEYENLFREEGPIELDPVKKSFSIDAAVTRFEKNLTRNQESPNWKRLIGQFPNLWRGRFSMDAIKLNQPLMAGTSLAVILALAVGGPVLYRLIDEPMVRPESVITKFDPASNNSAEVSKDIDTVMQSKIVQNQKDQNKQALIAEIPQQEALPKSLVVENETSKRSEEIASMNLTKSANLAEVVSPNFFGSVTDRFGVMESNSVKQAASEPISTFSIDVDTASYSFMRRSLMEGILPPKDAVRIEELINYFPYDYEVPKDRSKPFKADVTVMPTPWNPDTKLMHIGIKGFALPAEGRPRANLVFLVDTSGSMKSPDKLPLLINSLRLLLNTLTADDKVAIVTYAGQSRTVLTPTSASEKSKILSALDELSAGGTTAGAEGIRQAYSLAEQSFDAKAINRVILATDGDFNVGISSPRELQSFVERKRESGVYLSVLGFGKGNYNDELMQSLAQNGNGQAAYIDNLNEARKVLVEEMTSTIFPIANDVKIQVEFNPASVSEYRLIGYETRLLDREDFNNDKVDAGDIGAGHTVTAIYEITPKGSAATLLEPLRYGQSETPRVNSDEYAFVKIRYKLPGEQNSQLITEPVTRANENPSAEAKFAVAVAAFGQILRGGEYIKSFSYDDVLSLAQTNRGTDEFGYRSDFLNLVRLARSAKIAP